MGFGERVTKHERASANRRHLEIRLETPAQVDRELVAWLAKADGLAG
jgi:hypothetical protein